MIRWITLYPNFWSWVIFSYSLGLFIFILMSCIYLYVFRMLEKRRIKWRKYKHPQRKSNLKILEIYSCFLKQFQQCWKVNWHSKLTFQSMFLGWNFNPFSTKMKDVISAKRVDYELYMFLCLVRFYCTSLCYIHDINK